MSKVYFSSINDRKYYMLVVRTFLFLDFCEVVLKVACAQGFLFTVWVWDVIIALSRPVCCWIGMFRGVVQYYIHVVLSKFPLGGGVENFIFMIWRYFYALTHP